MSRKYTIEEARKFFEERRYVLISEEYVGVRTKLDCICPNGHKCSISFDKFLRGRRCLCGSDRTRLTIENIREMFEERSCILLSTEYKPGKKLDYICPNGHKHSIRFDHFKRGHGCPCLSGRSIITISFVRNAFEKNGYILKTTKYINNKQQLKYICPNGHEHSITWNNWVSGYRCPECAPNFKKTIELIRLDIGQYNYELMTTEYINHYQKLHLVCPNGHDYYVSWSNWEKGSRCPKCKDWGTSDWEKDIKNFVKKLDVSFVENDKKQLTNPKTNRYLELDVWFPHLRKAIECNSLYWHKHREHVDEIKQQLCQQQGIDLLVITDEEWNENIDKCKNKIINFIL